MSRKIVGVTVGTPTSPHIIKDKLKLATEEWVQEGYQPKGIVEMTDRTTGKKYKLYVDNGELMMEEVS